MFDLVYLLNEIDNIMYFPILIIVMAVAGLYFTIYTKGVQIRLFPESLRILFESRQMILSLPCKRCWYPLHQGLEPVTL